MKYKVLAILALLGAVTPALAGNIKGRVMADGKPLAGVKVSDGVNIVTTDAKGRYDIQSDKALKTVFITAPSGYMSTSRDGLRPDFWAYLTLPADQEEIHDFSLTAQDQSDYTVIFPADLHLTNDPRRQDLKRFQEYTLPLVNQIVGDAKGPVYSFLLGDFTHDIYWYQMDFDEADGLRFLQDVGYPTYIYNVTGNHDHDGAITGEDTDFRSGWMYRDCWGPDRYSVDIAGDHWVFLDDIIYKNLPGKGKRSKGINGDRSYDQKFTDSQMEWLRKDLQGLAPETNVYLCCHAPILRTTTRANHSFFPKEQMDVLDELAAGFNNGICIYSGHIHLWDVCAFDEHPKLFQWGLPATSGIMWETPADMPITSSDGSDSGVMTARFRVGEMPVHSFKTYNGLDRCCRIYDMNEVGKVYKADPVVRRQIEMFPDTRLDYGKSKYHNYVYINYWACAPGDRVEAFENGRPLKVTAINDADPVKNFSYDLPKIAENIPHHKARPSDSTLHMFAVRASSARSSITVRITDRNGKLIHEEVFARPCPFNPSDPYGLNK